MKLESKPEHAKLQLMPPSRVVLGIDLWKLYADVGRQLPASWIARTVGVSPTTMTKYLAIHCPDYKPRKGWNPTKGWNWVPTTSLRRICAMTDTMKFYSNGQLFEAGPEPTPEELKEHGGLPEEGTGLDFAGAMHLVIEGMAVSRMEDCSRVVFYDGKQVLTGSSDKKGTCVANGPYVPTKEDIDATDWMVDAHVAGET